MNPRNILAALTGLFILVPTLLAGGYEFYRTFSATQDIQRSSIEAVLGILSLLFLTLSVVAAFNVASFVTVRTIHGKSILPFRKW